MRIKTMILAIVAIAIWPSCSHVDLEDDFKNEITYPLLGEWDMQSLEYEKFLNTAGDGFVIEDHEKLEAMEMDYVIDVDTTEIEALGSLRISFLQEQNDGVFSDYTKAFGFLDSNASFTTIDGKIHFEGSLFDFQFNGFNATKRLGDQSFDYKILENGNLEITMDKIIQDQDVTYTIEGTEQFVSVWRKR